MKRLVFAVILALSSTAHANRFSDSLDALFGWKPFVFDEEDDPDFGDELLDLYGESGTYEWTAEGDLVFVPDQPSAEEQRERRPCRKGLDVRGACKDRK